MPRRPSVQEYEEIPAPASLYALLANTPHTVGELVDFAKVLPDPWVRPMVMNLMDALREDYRSPVANPAARRRKLVILGALIDRLTFEIESVPSRRSACI